jgi:hypothetical protein
MFNVCQFYQWQSQRGAWRTYRTQTFAVYYHNILTNEVSFDVPDDFVAASNESGASASTRSNSSVSFAVDTPAPVLSDSEAASKLEQSFTQQILARAAQFITPQREPIFLEGERKLVRIDHCVMRSFRPQIIGSLFLTYEICHLYSVSIDSVSS